MKVQSIAITAGTTYTVQGGNFFMLIDTSAPVTVQFYRKGSPTEQAVNVEGGYYSEPSPHSEWEGFWFDSADITTSTNQTIKVAVSVGEGGYQRSVGSVTATISQGSTVAESSVTCTLADTEYTAIAANASRKAVRFYNPSTNTGEMAIYGTTTTTRANAVIHLAPGQMWNEDDAAAALWYVKAEVATETLKVQAIT